MGAIDYRGVKKSFGETQVIHGVDLHIADGELMVIVGPSGCGKSTLLRMTAGLEAITEGEIAIAGRVVNKLEPAERDIAMVFQNYALYPHMSVYQNMAYGLKIQKVPKDEIDRRVRAAAETLELGELLRRRPRQLSGGQRQRVAMGRAIVREPAAFLFDEPLSNLDAKLRVQMRLEIKKLQAKLGVTSLYVTHDQVEAMTLGHRLVVMKDGIAEQVGAPLDVYGRPETTFVASFIGSPAMNLAPGTGGDGGVVIGSGAALPANGARVEPGRPVVVGLRPEHVGFGGDGPDFRVDMVEPLGADSLAHGHVPAWNATLTLRLDGAAKVAAGDTERLAFAPDALHLFDAETTRRIN